MYRFFKELTELVPVAVCAASLFLCLAGCQPRSVEDSDLHSSDAAVTNRDTTAASVTPSIDDLTNSIRPLVASEELILQLTPRMGLLNESVLNFTIPDSRARPLFADRISVLDLEEVSPDHAVWGTLPFVFNEATWPADGDERTKSIDELEIWSPLFSRVDYFENASFSLIDGVFSDRDLSRFDSRLGFSGLAKLNTGRYVYLKAEVDVQWRRSPPGPFDASTESAQRPTSQEWVIARWKLRRFHTVATDKLLFEDAIGHAIPDPSLRGRLIESKHWELAQRHYYPRLRATLPDNLADDRFFPISTANHPGLSVVDLDRTVTTTST